MKDILLREKVQRFVQTMIIGAGMLALLLWTGWQILGINGIVLFGAAGLLFLVLAGRRSTRIMFAQGVPLRYADAPELYQIVRELAYRANLPAVPRLYYLPSPVMNAVTVGRKSDSVILVTYGLLSRLTMQELQGVMAHEISHIRNNDMWIFSFALYLRQATDLISRFGWFLLLVSLPLMLISGVSVSLTAMLAMVASPLLSLVLQLALLRTREFSADLGAAELTDDPASLAHALQKIDNPRRTMFDYFLPVPRPKESSMFRTHPATEERIKRLAALAERQHHQELPRRVSGYWY